MLRRHTSGGQQPSPRCGAALDYVLVLAATLPIVLVIVVRGKRIMQLVWEMLCVQVSWPFL
jgi:presenilin-like A22 family membrane protease